MKQARLRKLRHLNTQIYKKQPPFRIIIPRFVLINRTRSLGQPNSWGPQHKAKQIFDNQHIEG
jgi:hypothetical protein